MLEGLGTAVSISPSTNVNYEHGGRKKQPSGKFQQREEVFKVFSGLEPALQCAAGKNAGIFLELCDEIELDVHKAMASITQFFWKAESKSLARIRAHTP